MSAVAGTLEASTHDACSPSANIAIQPGVRIELSGYEWGRRRLAVLYGGLIAEKMPPCVSIEQNVSRHEACHCTVSFLTSELPLGGASIIPVAGHSAGRTSNRLPGPGEKSISDKEWVSGLKLLGGDQFDLAEIERFTTQLLTDYQPLTRRLAGVLLERKVLTGRQVRRILLKALKKDLRRAKIVAEKDRREQAAFALVLEKELRS